MKMLSSPTSSRISTLAPSRVPMVRAPLRAAFMLPVPEASVPAVEICSDRSAAGIDVLGGRHVESARKKTLSRPLQTGSLLIASRERMDELDDELGHPVAGRGLAAEDDGARGDVRLGSACRRL